MPPSTISLNDLPEELLNLILSHVYSPWWLETTYHHHPGILEEDSMPEICGKPALPPTAPLLICRKFYHLAQNAGLSAFTGLLDVRTRSLECIRDTRWQPLYPLISRVGIGSLHGGLHRDDLHVLPAIRVIELLDPYSPLRRYLSESAVDTSSSWDPRDLDVFARGAKGRIVSVLTEQLLRAYEERWGRRPRVLLYVLLCGDVVEERTAQESTALLDRWIQGEEAVFNLIYEYCGVPGDLFEHFEHLRRISRAGDEDVNGIAIWLRLRSSETPG